MVGGDDTALLGAGGAFALVIDVRRQWLKEQAHLHAEGVHAINQAQRECVTDDHRVTELYNAAATQPGSATRRGPPRRVYTLGRLAGAGSDHRQSFVNIICAYLPSGWGSSRWDWPSV
ncbi:hypothetical protein ACFVH6_32800 [Spirillospora sp. NPDC127200]